MHERIPLATLSPVYHSRRASYNPNALRNRLILWLGGLGFAAFLGLALPAFFRWPHVISSSGGRYFVHRTVIPVPAFQQNDARWSLDLLGNTIDTVGQQGCAITSAAMVLSAYGVDIDPQRLNQYLTTHSGYVGDGLLVWEKAAEVGSGQVQKAYEDPPSYALIDQNILHGNPVIIRLHLRNGSTHFVVVVGKQGWDYLIRDPARPPAYGVYPLKELTSRIEALRYYTIVPPPVVPPVPAPTPGMPSVPATLAVTPVSSVTTPVSSSNPSPSSASVTPLPPFAYTTHSSANVTIPFFGEPRKHHKRSHPQANASANDALIASPAPPLSLTPPTPVPVGSKPAGSP